MKRLCHKCYASGIEVTLTKMAEKDGMIASIAVCEKCGNGDLAMCDGLVEYGDHKSRKLILNKKK